MTDNNNPAAGTLAQMRLDGTTKMFCVFGDPIAHTFSPRIHEILIRAHGGNMAYTAHHVKPEHIGDAIRGAWAMEIAGINLTIPHKEISMPYLCGIDSAARKVGAVNTLKWTPDGYYGYNTDVYGMRQQLRTGGMFLEGQDVLLIGAGGAARGALTVCQLEKAARVRIYNRHRKRAEALLARFLEAAAGEEIPEISVISYEEMLETEHPYVLQTTPAGMKNIADPLPVMDESFYHGIKAAADAVYRPKDTLFLQRVRQQGGLAVDGLPMLFYQGARSFEIWNDFTFDDAVRERAKREFLEWADTYFA